MDPPIPFPSGASKNHGNNIQMQKQSETERESGIENIRQGGLESMQYSRSWSCSMGRWVMSAIDQSFDTAFSGTVREYRGRRREQRSIRR